MSDAPRTLGSPPLAAGTATVDAAVTVDSATVPPTPVPASGKAKAHLEAMRGKGYGNSAGGAAGLAQVAQAAFGMSAAKPGKPPGGTKDLLTGTPAGMSASSGVARKESGGPKDTPKQKAASKGGSTLGVRHTIKLTDDQRNASSYGLGTRAVVATAGSGKTTTMSYRIAGLMEDHGVPDHEILATTFTNAGANDLKARIDAMTGRRTSIQTGTVHSFCVRLLFIHAHELGYVGSPTILDERQRAAQIDQLMLQVTGKTEKRDITTFSTDDVNRWLGELDVREFSSDPRDQSPYTLGKKPPGAVLEICRIYRERAKQFGYLDFDSILTEALRLLRKAPPAVISSLPKYVFIDEAQDLSAIQWFIIEQLAKHAKSLDIIGDDDQSIYGWRGALPWRFRDFVEKADHKYFLSANRRSSAAIVRLAGQIIGTIPPTRRIAKDLSSVREEEGCVRFSVLSNIDSVLLIAKKIKGEVDLRKKSFSDYALIVRATTRTFDALEGAFKKTGVPYKILGGKSTFDRPEARLIKAIGNLIIKKDGVEAFAHWSSLFAEIGVTGTAADKMLKEAQGMAGGGFESVVWAVRGSRIAEGSKRTAEGILGSIRSLREVERPTLGHLFRNSVIAQTVQEVIYKKAKGEVEARRKREGGITQDKANDMIDKNAQERAVSLETAMSGMINDPLAAAMISLDLSSKDEDDDGLPKVTMSTAHSSKGLEWDSVFVMECNSSTWPSAMAGRGIGNVPTSVREDILDEEKRLLYVAITRAKNDLYLVSTAVHPMNHNTQDPSEFLPGWLRRDVQPAFDEVRQSNVTKGLTINVPAIAAGQTPKGADFKLPKTPSTKKS